jgi:hypothetical protein
MASAAGSSSRISRIAGVILLPGIAYGAYMGKGTAAAAIEAFFTGPGRTSRIIALAVVLVNWKSLPLAWTVSHRLPHESLSYILSINKTAFPRSSAFSTP